LAGAGKARRHDRLLNLVRIAERAGHEPALRLLLVVGRVLKPDLEIMLAVAMQRVADHGASLPTTCRCVASAIGWRMSNRRPCWSAGMRPRAVVTAAGSISAMMTPGSSPPSASTRPQGSTTIEWP